jgi:hypothetical protein
MAKRKAGRPALKHPLLDITPAEVMQLLDLLVRAGGPNGALLAGQEPVIDVPPDAVFDVKITLVGLRPPVTRTIAVPDFTLGDLHWAIQIAMGWQNCHMHEFQVRGTGERYGAMPDDDSPFGLDFGVDYNDEDSVTLADFVESDDRRLVYTYDFGDSWQHEILISKPKFPKPGVVYPYCVRGALACPPEDCGGVWGYLDLCEILRKPAKERSAEQQDMLDWAGAFDPDAFDAEAVTRELQKSFPPPKPRKSLKSRKKSAGKKKT